MFILRTDVYLNIFNIHPCFMAFLLLLTPSISSNSGIVLGGTVLAWDFCHWDFWDPLIPLLPVFLGALQS